MSSLIYITRIQSLSAEAIHALESSGVHVKSFGAGEITADECVLVMTSDALLAGVRRPGKEPRSAPSLDAIQGHLGADAAIWNCLKAGGVAESAAVESKAASEKRLSASVVFPAIVPEVIPHTDNLGFVASQAGVRALAASQLLPAKKKETLERDQGQAGGRLGLQSVRSLWPPVALVALLSVFAMMLLAGRHAVLPASGIATVDSRDSGAASVAGVVDRGVSAVTSSKKLSNPASDARHYISDYDFVAEDYTTHFDQHSRPAATTQAPGLHRKGRERKRVVN